MSFGFGFSFPANIGVHGLWTPAQITTALWLDAAETSTITLNGTTVSQWSDRSGNGRNATQSTASKQPTYIVSGINGKPALAFNAVASNFMNTGTLNVAMRNDYTVIATLFTANTSTGLNWYLNPGFLGGERDGATTDHGLGFSGLTPITGIGLPDTTLQATNPVSSNVSAITYWDRTSSTGVCRWYLNGTANGTGTGASGARTASLGMALGSMSDIGASPWLSFTVGEIVVTNSVLSTSNRQLVEGYLAWKWGLQSSLPIGHPYKNVPPMS